MPNDEMKVITIMTRKGGAGKTTLAQALMSAAVSKGKRCLALDADPQQGLHRWLHEYARGEPLVTFRQLEYAADLAKWSDEAYESGEVDLVFVDTQGAAGAWADELAAQSDILVVPMRLGKTDYLITTDTVNWYSGLLDRMDKPELAPPLRVIVSGATAKPTKTEREYETLAVENFPVLRTYFMHRKQHLDAAAQEASCTIWRRRSGPRRTASNAPTASTSTRRCRKRPTSSMRSWGRSDGLAVNDRT